MKRFVAAVLVVLAACGGEPRYRQEDLQELVLHRNDAPKGTTLIDGSSGLQTLEEYAEDRRERARLQQAGFLIAYLNLFFSPGLFKDGQLDRISTEGSMAVSFALLFRNTDGAGQGLNVLEMDVREDGQNLVARPTTGLPAESIALQGTLDPTLPPGFLYAWRRGNAVFGVIAAGAPGVIKESAALALALRMSERQ